MAAVLVAERTPVGLRIRQCRDARGWSQATLARQADLDRGWVSLVELGDITQPGQDKLERVARALGVTTDYLRYGAGAATVTSLAVAQDDLADFAWFGRLPRWARRAALHAADAMLREVPSQPDDSSAGPEPGDERSPSTEREESR